MDAPTLLSCPACGSALREADVNLERGVATCPSCRAAMLLPPRPSEPAAPPKRRIAGLPKGVSVSRGPGGTVLTRNWFTPAAIFLLVFTCFWNGFLLVWYGLALGSGAPLLFVLFPILHVAAGIGMAWFTAASFLNMTTVTAGSGGLSVRHGPVPWPGRRDIPRAGLLQLYCREQRGSKGSRSYELWAALASGDRVRVLTSGADLDQALWFEQEIERALGIRDRAEQDEFRG